MRLKMGGFVAVASGRKRQERLRDRRGLPVFMQDVCFRTAGK
jgi:hypothetical protein